MATELTDAELAGYLDETLPPAELARVEELLRGSEELNERLSLLRRQRDRGLHSVGTIWRRYRIGCPSRSQLGSYLLEAIDPAVADYIRFHVEVAGCRLCTASLEDLREQQVPPPESQKRRRRFFQSSVGYLRGKRGS